MLKQKKQDTDESVPGWRDKAAGKISGASRWLQSAFAERMNKSIGQLPTAKLKLWLVIFCLVAGGGSIYFIIQGLTGQTSNSIKVQPIEVPKHFEKTGSEFTQPENAVSEDLYRDIQNYKRYMDSSGQQIPRGLKDSIAVIEKIYQSQK